MRSHAEYRKILEYWEKGYNKSRIAQMIDIPRPTIRDCIDRFGSIQSLDEHLQQEREKNTKDYEIARSILQLWEEGRSKKAIQETLGVSKYKVRACIQEYRSVAQLDRIYFQEEKTSSLHPDYQKKYQSNQRRYSDKELQEAVQNSDSIAETLRQLGIKPAGGNYETIKKRIAEAEIDISHFTGQGWLSNQKNHIISKRSLEEILIENSTYKGSSHLRNRLLKEEIFESYCQNCGLDMWLEQPIPLELHHVNGDKFDNRLENLQLLCPNCHALTENYRGKNISITETT